LDANGDTIWAQQIGSDQDETVDDIALGGDMVFASSEFGVTVQAPQKV